MELKSLKKVVLVGTTHSIQRGGHPDFWFYVKSLVVKYSPLAIAEELDQGAPSVANEIAISFRLAHSIIEPSCEERKQLGISSLNSIENDIFMEYDDHNSIEAEKEFAMRKENSYRARELEWFKRINGLNIWPVLVICGAAHYQPFSELLKENGLDVITENENWGRT